MKVKITGCTDSMMWYYNHVGETFNVLDDYTTEYMVRDAYGFRNIIKKKDCVILPIDDTTSL